MAVEVATSHLQITDASGNPLSGAKIFIYDSETTSLKTVYSDPDLDVSHEAANPIITDSAGRHPMRYIEAGSYKYWVKTSADVAVYDPRDEVDGRVPVGSGVLAIENGGTGAASAGAAIAALGAASASELADVAADVAAVTGALGSVEKTHLATGTTLQRVAVPVEGDVRRNTDTDAYEGFSSTEWVNFITSDFGSWLTEDTSPAPATDFILTYDTSATTTKKVKPASLATALNATQTEMEAGSATTALVSPAVAHFHGSAAKCWANLDGTGTISMRTNRNCSGQTDNGTGDYSFAIATDFSSADWVAAFSIRNGTSDRSFEVIDTSNAPTAGALRVKCGDSTNGTAQDAEIFNFVGFGDI